MIPRRRRARALLLLAATITGAAGGVLGAPSSHGLGPLLATAATLPATPVIAAVAPRGLGALVSWTPNPASDNVTAYTAAASTASAAPNGCAAPTPVSAAGTDSAVEVTGLCPAVAYTITLTANNAAGGSLASAPSNPVVPLPAQVPSAPLIVSVLGRAASLVVSWSPPDDTGGSALTGYALKANAGGRTVALSPAASAAQATLTGLSNGTKYKLSLVARNSIGGSAVTTGDGTPEAAYVPGPPQSFTAIPDGSGDAVTATWAAPTDDGGSPITGYAVTYQQEVRNPSDSAWVLAPGSSPTTVQAPSSATSLTVGSLPADEYFTFAITAGNAVGAGVAANVAAPVAPTTQLTSVGVALTSPTMAALGSDVNGQLTWPTPAPAQVASLQVGNVLVGGTSPAAPYGLIATVQTISQPSSGTYVVTTTPAALSDAVKDLSLAGATDLLLSGGAFHPALAGVRGVPKVGAGLSDQVTLSISAFAGLGAANVHVGGQVSITPTLSVDLTLNQGFLGIPDGATLSVSAKVQFQAQASVAVIVSGNATHPVGEIDIGDIYGPPIDIQAGPIPVVIRPYIPVYLSVSGTVSLSLEASETIGASMSWSSNDSGNLHPQNLSSRPQLSATPQAGFDATVTGQVGLSIEPTIQIEGVANPYVKAFLGLQVTYDAAGAPYFAVGPVLQLAVGFQLKFLTFDAGFEISLAKLTFPAFRINKAPPPTLSVTPSSAYVAPGQQQQYTATRSDGASDPVTWALVDAVAGDAISDSGLLTAVAPAGRSLTVTARDSTGLIGETVVSVIAAEFDPPVDLSVSRDATGTNATVSWSPPANTGGSSLTGYTLITVPSSAVQSVPASSTGATITGLRRDTSYLLEVWATNSAGLDSTPATAVLGVGGWTIVGSPDASSTQVNVLDGVSCVTSSFCVAAGAWGGSVPFQTLIEAWNGSSWGIVSSPNTSSTQYNYLESVSCISSSFCVAAGYTSCGSGCSDSHAQTLIEAWNGTSWSIVSSPNASSTQENYLYSVSCVSSSFCVAAGYSQISPGVEQTLIEAWNGTSWSIVSSPNTSGAAGNRLYGVSCVSSSFCVAAGYARGGSTSDPTLIEAWNGTSWSIVSSPNTSSTQNDFLFGVSCVSRSFCAAVGAAASTSSGVEQTLVEAWNGASWSIVSSPNTTSTLNNLLDAVSCVSSSFCVAPGSSSDDSGSSQTLIETWNGTSWGIVSAPNPSTVSNLDGVSCVSSSFCVAAGYAGRPQTLIEQT